MSSVEERVWVFNGSQASFPAGVFSDITSAEAAISNHELSGTLTEFPVGWLSYDWAKERGLYKPPISGRSANSHLISRYVSEYQSHFHYENGVRIS